MESREISETVCPRCGHAFRCQPEDIAHCQCSQIKLSPETLNEIVSKYAGCLCLNCLREIESEIAGSQVNPSV